MQTVGRFPDKKIFYPFSFPLFRSDPSKINVIQSLDKMIIPLFDIDTRWPTLTLLISCTCQPIDQNAQSILSGKKILGATLGMFQCIKSFIEIQDHIKILSFNGGKMMFNIN